MSKQQLFVAPDISSHQGNVNIKTMRDAGYNRVFLRAGYGKNNVDKRFAANAPACLNLSVATAVYWFSYALSAEMARQEALYAIAQAGKYWKGCPIAYDLEYDTVRYAATKGMRIGKAEATAFAIAFLKEVAAAGYVPVLYTNRDYLRNYFDIKKIKLAVPGVKLWFALYSNSIPAAELAAVSLWQFTSKGSIPGVTGNVDLNKVYEDIWNAAPVANVPQIPTKNLYIQSFQTAANADGYRDQNGKQLVADGFDGGRTQYVRKQIKLRAKRVKLLWVERSRGKLVEWLQQRLNEVMDAGLVITGEYDVPTEKAVGAFQAKYNLKPDKIAGYNTIQMLFYN